MTPNTSAARSDRPAEHDRGLFLTGSEIILPFIEEPTRGREGVYCPYESMPFDTNRPELSGHQDDVCKMHRRLVDRELGDHVSKSVLNFTHHSIESRMTQRDGTNNASYRVRMNARPNLHLDGLSSQEIMYACRAGHQGIGAMWQNEVARRAYGMSSVEYGNLTIINGRRGEYLEPMLDEASELVGERVHDILPYRIGVVGFDREPDGEKTQHLGAMRLSMKRELGTLDDGTKVKQRTFAIIDMSLKAGNDPAVLEAIFAEYAREKEQKRRAQLARIPLRVETREADQELILQRLASRACADRECNYVALPEVQDLISELLVADMDDPRVLARNETIYGYNENVEASVRRCHRTRGALGAVARRLTRFSLKR